MTEENVTPIGRGRKKSAKEVAIDAAARAEKKVSERKADVLLDLALEYWRPGKTETGSPMAVPLDGAPLAIVVGDRMADTFKDELAHLSSPAYTNRGLQRIPFRPTR